MKHIWEILTKHKHAIIWTACYITIMWCILQFLFNFDMFSVQQWIRVSHAHLHGFGGFVFGILTLAALPLYVATTTIIWRNQAPLITIPTPKLNKNAVANESVSSDTQTVVQKTERTLPANLPPELSHQFIKLRKSSVNLEQFSQYTEKNSQVVVSTDPSPTQQKTPEVAVQPVPQPVPVMANVAIPSQATTQPQQNAQQSAPSKSFIDPENKTLPLPDEFDFADDATDSQTFADINFGDMPKFTDIDFDNNNDADNDADDSIGAAEQQLVQYLCDKNITLQSVEESVIITDKFAIAIHDDPDFWIADEPDWFAQGKQKKSPITELQTIATSNNKKPIFWLAQTNIMDLENKTAQWEQDGIIVITDLNQIPE